MWLWKRKKKTQTAPTANETISKKVTLSDVPDAPQPFGYKIDWMAIRDVEPDFVAKQLGLDRIQPANWETGLKKACEVENRMCFVSPPVNGWCLLVSRFYLSMDTGEHIDYTLKALQILSSDNNVAHAYGSYRVVDYCAWAKAENGEITRAFSYLGDKGIVLNIGDQTAEEKELGFADYSGLDIEQATEKWLQLLENEDDQWMIDEEDVTKLAGLWSMDPTLLDDAGSMEKGVGLVGRLPKKLLTPPESGLSLL